LGWNVRPKSERVNDVTEASTPSSTVAAWNAASAWLTWERRFCCVPAWPAWVSKLPCETKKTWRFSLSVSRTATICATAWSCRPMELFGNAVAGFGPFARAAVRSPRSSMAFEVIPFAASTSVEPVSRARSLRSAA
jgi:hypothetical protein